MKAFPVRTMGGWHFLVVAAVGLVLGTPVWAHDTPAVLYHGEGEWAVAAGLPAGSLPPSADWAREGDL